MAIQLELPMVPAKCEHLGAWLMAQAEGSSQPPQVKTKTKEGHIIGLLGDMRSEMAGVGAKHPFVTRADSPGNCARAFADNGVMTTCLPKFGAPSWRGKFASHAECVT